MESPSVHVKMGREEAAPLRVSEAAGKGAFCIDAKARTAGYRKAGER